MRIRLKQAIYGEKNNAHELLSTSGNDRELFNDLKRFTDLPTHFPPGVDWEPYLTGLGFGDYFLFARTAADHSANRSGMVLTHLILMDRADVASASIISPILDLLPDVVNRAHKLDEIVLDLDDSDVPFLTPGELPKGYGAVAERLLSGGTPILWEGSNENFTELLLALWARLPSQLRTEMSFGMTINPNDLEDRNLSIARLGMPKTNRWANYSVLGETSSPTAKDVDDEWLVTGRTRRFSEFLRDLEISRVDFSQLPMIAQGFRYADTAQKETIGFEDAVNFVRLLETLSPSSNTAKEIKQVAATAIVASLPSASIDAITRARNLSPSSLASSVKTAFRDWLSAQVARSDHASKEFVQLALLVAHEKSGILFDQLQVLLASPSSYKFLSPFLWDQWFKDEAAFEGFSPLISDDQEAEAELIKALPKVGNKLLWKRISEWSLKRGWSKLSFLAAWRHLTPLQAISYARTTIKDRDLPKVIRSVRKSLSDSELFSAVCETKIESLSSEVVDIITRTPETSNNLDLRSSFSQGILEAVLVSDPSFLDRKGVDATRIVTLLLDMVVEGREVAEGLITPIYNSQKSHLVGYHNRSLLWDKLPGSIKNKLLSDCIDQAAELIASRGVMPDDLEPEIERGIADSRVIRRILNASGPRAPSTIINIFRKFDQLSQSEFEEQLIAVQQHVRKLNYVDASQLGEFIADRAWSRSANRIASDVLDYGRKDLIPSVERCSHLLGIWNKFFGAVTGSFTKVVLTRDEWWAIFLDSASQLYPEGPQDQAIWSRAQGSKRTLEYNGSGLRRWERALEDLRNGGGGRKISTAGLLDEMVTDYPNNSRLKGLIALDSQIGDH